MDNNTEPVLSDEAKAVIKQAIEEGKAMREKKSIEEAQYFHTKLKEQYEAQHIKELAVLHEVLQENSHLAPGSWGKSIILVAADIIREYGKEKCK